VLMAASKEKESGWEFMKWLTSADTQYQYGKELENVMGVGARYNTANLEAMKMLPWRTSEIEVLLEQMDATQGVPEVPGGYMTSRNVGFAIATVYSENVSTRDTLLGYIDQINQEMLLKRREFGLE
jgi:ABC-type glycerol-3-phosphate transport system substrate-binding protein